MHYDNYDYNSGGNSSNTIFRDVILLALAGFVAMVLLMLPHLNPPKKDSAKNDDSPGNVIVELRWPDDIDADVDLWVQAPGDVPVGYSNKGGKVFNLLRDDLGIRADATGLNYENSYSRGIPVGEYTVNVHLYRDTMGSVPFGVRVVVSVKVNQNTSSHQILARTLTLTREGREITVFRFKLDAAGELVPGSVHELEKKIRSWRGS